MHRCVVRDSHENLHVFTDYVLMVAKMRSWVVVVVNWCYMMIMHALWITWLWIIMIGVSCHVYDNVTYFWWWCLLTLVVRLCTPHVWCSFEIISLGVFLRNHSHDKRCSYEITRTIRGIPTVSLAQVCSIGHTILLLVYGTS